MNSQRDFNTRLQVVRATVLAAVAELDLRGSDRRVTEAMCVIEEAFDVAVAGNNFPPSKIAARGVAVCGEA